MAEGSFVTKFLTSDTNGIPNWAWGAIVIVGLGVGVFVKNKFSNSSKTPPTPLPTTGTGPVDTNPGPAGPPTLAPYPYNATARASGLFPTWDNAHTGVPVRLLPDGNSPAVYYVAFGGPVSIIGPSVSGGPASGGYTGSGNTTWYPVTGGYLSAIDVVGGQ